MLALLASLLLCAPAQQDGAPLDLIVAGGTVHDGSGDEPRLADVGIRGDKIAAVGDLSAAAAKRRLDAKGLIVCPGFIDLHNHGDPEILRPQLRQNTSYLTQGCTTIVTGNCGGGEIDVASWLGRLEKSGVGVNVAHLLPLGSIRRRAMGGSFDRPPSDEEMARMRDLVTKGMQAGAFGLSTGLIYTPGSFASTDEIVDLARIVGQHGGFYASHIRGEEQRLLGAIDEAIAIGERASLPVHVSHLKASTPPCWGKVKDACARIEAARARGQRVTADQYPYAASSTSLAAFLLPDWAREGSQQDVVARIDDPQAGPRVRAAIAASLRERASDDRSGPESILIASYAKRPEWNGKSLAAIAAEAGVDPVDAVLDVLRGGGAQAIGFSMCEPDVEFVMQQPWVATASDGSSKVKDASQPHPRSYGTFSRKIGLYALERKVVGLAQAIHSASGLPAAILGLKGRGILRPGQAADVLVFDPATFRDRATFAEPHQHSTGVRWLLVNGQLSIDEGKPTKALAGRVQRMVR